MRELPLSAIVRIHLPTHKFQQTQPNSECLRLQDGGTTIEAEDVNGLAARLREMYPDEWFELTLHSEQDLKTQHELSQLAKVFARAAVERFLRDSNADDRAK